MSGCPPLLTDAMDAQDLLDATVDAVIVIDHRGIVQRFNRAAEGLFGFRASEVAGRNVTILMTEPDAVKHDAYLERFAASGVGHIIGIGREVQARRKDGSVFPAFLSVGCIARSDPPRYVGFLHDLTVRKQALTALERERDRFSRYLAAVQSILVGIDASHRITLINRKGCETLGQQESALLGADWFQTSVDAAHREASTRDFDRLVQQHEPSLYCEYPVVTATGERRVIAWRCTVVEDDLDGLPQVLCSGDDVTDTRRADRELQAARDRMMQVSRLATLGEMASGISHELNQPLAAIATYAQAGGRLLAAEEPDLGDLREALQEIAGQALRAGDIIRRLRSLVRSQSSAREPCDLNELVQELSPLLHADVKASDVRLSFELAPALPRVSLDRMQLQQVVLNLVRNAIDALLTMPTGERSLIIRSEAPARHEVHLTIIDTGPGVSEELRQRLFVPFVTTKENGTGLGLAISRTIVESHRGRLDILPTQPHGATLRVTLPAYPED